MLTLFKRQYNHLIMAKLEYCVIGLSRFGIQVADQLKSYGKSVMVLDINQDLIDVAAKKYDVAVKCDCTDLKNLVDLGIQNTKIVIVACDNLENDYCPSKKHDSRTCFENTWCFFCGCS